MIDNAAGQQISSRAQPGRRKVGYQPDIQNQCELIEYKALRNEMILRIFFQNVLLFIITGFFLAVALTVVLFPMHAWLLCAIYSVGSGALGVQWCHHGVRIAQLKKYIMISEGRMTKQVMWEQWLPANRPKTFLGSKWLLATKGVLIGLQLAAILLCVYTSARIDGRLLLSTLVLFVGTSLLILTNEKEAIEEISDVELSN